MADEVELGDVEWGEVVSDAAGVLVVQAVADGRHVVVKRFGDLAQRREIFAHALLVSLAVPVPTLLGSGDDWLVQADVAEDGYRQATSVDLTVPQVGTWIARWYDQLHSAGTGVVGLDGLHSETDVLTAQSLHLVGQRWPELAPSLDRLMSRLDDWLTAAAAFPQTLTHNDFAVSNLAIDDFGERAMMVVANALGRGYRSADLRAVTRALDAGAAQAFRAEYDRLQHRRGTAVDPAEAAVDVPLGHLVALVTAASCDQFPAWAEQSRTWVLGQ